MIGNTSQRAVIELSNEYQEAAALNNFGQKASDILNSSQEAIRIRNFEQKEADKIFVNVGKSSDLILVNLSKNEVEFGSFRGTYEQLLEESTEKYGKNNPYLEVIDYWKTNRKR